MITCPDRLINNQGRRGPCGRTTAKAAPDRRGHCPYQKSGSVHRNARIDRALLVSDLWIAVRSTRQWVLRLGRKHRVG